MAESNSPALVQPSNAKNQLLGLTTLLPTSPERTLSKNVALLKVDAAAHRSPLAQALTKARSDALRGGLAGAAAQVFNVFTLMWMRTTMNYQYRNGGTTRSTIRALYRQGGIPRFYRGLVPALMQSPMSRFGDAAANVGVFAFLEEHDSTRNLPISIKTMLASCGAASWRLMLMPIDAWKTTKQVDGGDGLKNLIVKVRKHGPTKLYHGSVAAMGATWVGHYPWFFTHNYLNHHIPAFEFENGKYIRSAMIGFCSSVVSDTCSNSIRVVKTTRQTSVVPMSYIEVVKTVVAKDGVLGLMGRGLATRIATNGMQGMMFSVGWRTIQDMLKARDERKQKA